MRLIIEQDVSEYDTSLSDDNETISVKFTVRTTLLPTLDLAISSHIVRRAYIFQAILDAFNAQQTRVRLPARVTFGSMPVLGSSSNSSGGLNNKPGHYN